MRLAPDQALEVRLRWSPGDEQRVGRLAWRDRRAWVEFDEAFVASSLPLSPIRLPVRPGLVAAPPEPFAGLFGVFADSLPDGWGLLLQDRRASSLGLSPAALTPLDRLAWVGDTGIGALAYRPALMDAETDARSLDLDRLAERSARILAGAADDVLPELLRLGGSPQGARPKVLVALRPSDHHVVSMPEAAGHVPALVKFRAAGDGADAGAVEFAYHGMARDAGLDLPGAWLLPSRDGGGWFAVERFDLRDGSRQHVHTLCGLLHADHRLPSLDYVGVLTAVHRLTGDYQQLVQMYRRMVFNVLAHNRDDHSKQVSLRMDREGRWTLAPAYDLTFAEGPGGEHSTSVVGQGRPEREHLLRAAAEVGIGARTAADVVDEIGQVVRAGWPHRAAEAGVRPATIERIRRRLL